MRLDDRARIVEVRFAAAEFGAFFDRERARVHKRALLETDLPGHGSGEDAPVLHDHRDDLRGRRAASQFECSARDLKCAFAVDDAGSPGHFAADLHGRFGRYADGVGGARHFPGGPVTGGFPRPFARPGPPIGAASFEHAVRGF